MKHAAHFRTKMSLRNFCLRKKIEKGLKIKKLFVRDEASTKLIKILLGIDINRLPHLARFGVLQCRW